MIKLLNSPFTTSEQMLENFKEDFSYIIPDILQYCIAADKETEALYIDKINKMLNKHCNYVSDLFKVLDWFGEAELLNKDYYQNLKKGTYNKETVLEAFEVNEDGIYLLDKVVNMLIDIDCAKTAESFQDNKETIGTDYYEGL